MGNAGQSDAHNGSACPEEDGRYNPTAFRWRACTSSAEQQHPQGWWLGCHRTKLRVGLGHLENLGVTPWVGALLLCGVVLGLVAYPYTTTAPASTGKQIKATHFAQFNGEQLQAQIGHRPFQETPGALVPMGSESSRVTVMDKVTVLQANNRGQYVAAGRVNDVPVDFVLSADTRFVTISTEMAVMAGIKTCVPIPTDQGDQMGAGCKAVTPILAFGGYQVRNVEVLISDAIREHPVLGSNVLRLFNIKHHGSRLFFSVAT